MGTFFQLVFAVEESKNEYPSEIQNNNILPEIGRATKLCHYCDGLTSSGLPTLLLA